MGNEDWRERADRIDKQIAFIRELQAQAKIRAAEAKKVKKRDDERLNKEAELGADTHEWIRNLLKIVQSRQTRQPKTAKQHDS